MGVKNNKKIILGILCIAVLLIVIAFLFFLNFNPGMDKNLATVVTKNYDSGITEDSETIFNNKDALYSYVKKFGPKKTVQYLNQLSAKFGSCHDVAHRAGRYAYEVYNEESFKLRVLSEKNPSFTGKLLTVMRNQFGQHNVKGEKRDA